MLNPLGVVARAIRGRSSGLGWRGGATVVEHAGERRSGLGLGLGASIASAKGKGWVTGAHRDAGWSGKPCRGRDGGVRRRRWGGARGQGGAALLRASGLHGWTREDPATVPRGQGGP